MLSEVQKEVLDQVKSQYLGMFLKKTNGRLGQATQIAGIHPRGYITR